MSSDLKWGPHIQKMVAKANRMLGLLKRTCLEITNVRVRRALFFTLVKSQHRQSRRQGLGKRIARNMMTNRDIRDVLHDIGKNLDQNNLNKQTDMLYLDFSKAFDSVDHDILLYKLQRHGRWFESYLNDRWQRTLPQHGLQ